ncbi:MAG: AAA family ATPase, partial [Propionibacteriaceae bacterium]|nr:AAA family ATPase [Propionibacteriaceae bacterium]
MRTIAVGNMAGSAGKTTTVVTLAALHAQLGRKVLVIDADAQANATQWLGVDPDAAAATTGSVLLRRASIRDAATGTNTPNIDVVPSNRTLDADLFHLATAVGAHNRLRSALADLDGYDLVLVDCPGSGSTMTVAALAAADQA